MYKAHHQWAFAPANDAVCTVVRVVSIGCNTYQRPYGRETKVRMLLVTRYDFKVNVSLFCCCRIAVFVPSLRFMFAMNVLQREFNVFTRT